MFNWFKKKATKDYVERLEQGVQTSFEQVKEDISDVSKWIKHLNTASEKQKEQISDVFEDLSTIKSELENIKNVIDLLGNNRLFKQRQTVFNKQTAVGGVQTAVQTAVQGNFLEGFLNSLSITERSIVWILLNSELKLSYDDIAAMTGKERATIRGQLNSIKQKSQGLVAEQIEGNNKKRFYIPEKFKGLMLKKVKVKVRPESE